MTTELPNLLELLIKLVEINFRLVIKQLFGHFDPKIAVDLTYVFRGLFVSTCL